MIRCEIICFLTLTLFLPAQRMSVLVEKQPTLSESVRYSAFVKGAPETIEKLCTPKSSENIVIVF